MYSITVSLRDGGASCRLVETDFGTVFNNILAECYNNGGRFVDEYKEIYDVTRISFNGVELNWDQFTSVIAMRDIVWPSLNLSS